MSYVNLIYHIILRTKASKKVLPLRESVHLYRYINGVVNAVQGKLYQINGIEDHVHLCVSIHPAVSVASFVNKVKSNSSRAMKTMPGFERFEAWGVGYAALTYSLRQSHTIIRYIANQREHHRVKTFRQEYEAFLAEMGLVLDERDWER